MATKKTPPKTNPFAKVATEKKGSSTLDVIVPDDNIAHSVDEYTRIAGVMKSLKGEQEAHKSVLETYAKATYADRAVNRNKSENFNIAGDNDTVQYQLQNASAGMIAGEYEAFCERFGTDTAEDLLKLDTASVKFNSKVLEEPGVMDQVVDALQKLPGDLLDRLFTPAVYTVSKDAVDRIRNHVKTPEEFSELVSAAKIKNFIKS